MIDLRQRAELELQRLIEAIIRDAPTEQPNTIVVSAEMLEPRKPLRPSPDNRPLALLVEAERTAGNT